jgi:hypothetical protein
VKISNFSKESFSKSAGKGVDLLKVRVVVLFGRA